MNKATVILWSVLGLMLFQACDPARVLIIKAANKPNISVTVYANKNILPLQFPYHPDSAAQKITIQVPADTVPKREKLFLYGIGGWGNDQLLSDFSKNIDSIILITNKGKTALTTQASIHHYLLKHRSGFAKHVLTIEAK